MFFKARGGSSFSAGDRTVGVLITVGISIGLTAPVAILSVVILAIILPIVLAIILAIVLALFALLAIILSKLTKLLWTCTSSPYMPIGISVGCSENRKQQKR